VPFWAYLLPHVANAVLLLTIVFVFVRARQSECWSFTAYLVTVLVTSSLMSFWPSRFYNPEFYLLSQGLYDILTLLVGVEIAHRVFRRFPGARPLAHVVVLAILVLSTAAFLAIPRQVPYETWFEWQPRIVASTVWLFTAVGFLILWFRVPVHQWHRRILLGFTPYLLVSVTVLGILRDLGWDFRIVVGAIDVVAYIVLVSWWAWAASRPKERIEMTPGVAHRLGLGSPPQPRRSASPPLSRTA